MASNYTGLGVQLMTTGEKAGTWGTLTNTNWNIMEQISGGYVEQSIAGGAQTTTLAVSDGSAGATLANRVIKFTGSITGDQIVTIPLDVETFYIITNGTTDGAGTPTVQFKYVSGSDSGVTWAASDKGTKIVYASASDATNPALVDTGFGTGDVTLTGTQTLTNKTLTAPKIVDGGFIADGGGDENLVFGEVGTPVNELKITNAATGSGPILSAVSTSATDSNIDINVTPLGTGNVNLLADTVQCGDLNAAVTVTSNGTGDLILNTNNGTASGNITITDAADGDISFTNNGSGNVVFNDAAYNPETSLTDAATITWDSQAMPITKVTLTDNRILAAPTNGAAGQFISLLIIQDATGSRTLTWNAVFEFPLEAAPTLTTTAALGDLFVFRYHNSKWLQVGATLALTVA
jgi:hypothetical protein